MLFLSFLHSLLIFWLIFTFYTAIESYEHVDYTCFIHFEKSQKMKALGQKKCYKNSEPPNLELYPLIHFILPSIQKLSNFQVSYHFGKLLSSWFQNFCRFCNILTKGYFIDLWKKGTFFCSPFMLSAKLDFRRRRQLPCRHGGGYVKKMDFSITFQYEQLKLL